MEINALLKDVRMKIATGDFGNAKELLFSTEEQEGNVETQALKARILGFTDGVEKAQSMFFDLESVWPDNFKLFKMHCDFLQEIGNYNEAIAIGRQVVSKFKLEPDAYMLQIENYELAGMNSDALNLCNQALINFPDSIDFYNKKQMLLSITNDDSLIDESLENIKSEMTVKHIVTSDENILIYLSLFKGRRGVHAVQTKMGKMWGYIPEHRDMLAEDIRMHISGQKTLGIYVTDIQNVSNLMVLDLDIRKPYMKNYAQNPEERTRLTELLRANCKSLLALCNDSGLFPLVESSGNKGLHFWFFSSEPIACKYWRALGGWLINRLISVPEELSWEVFPKQDKVSADGLGNLVKLPLGTHQKTGRQSLFIDVESFEPYEDQIEILKNVNKLSKKDFEHILGTITIQNCKSGNITGFKDIEFKPAKNDYAPKCLEEVNENFKIDVQIPLPERNTIEVEQVLSGCRPMWEIMQKAKNEHYLTQDEKHAFVYVFASLGEEGKVFVHQVLNQLEDYQPDLVNQLIRAVPPNPTGCNKIRKRIPHLCSNDCCSCQFRLPNGSYASPVVHAGIFPNTGNFNVYAVRQPAKLAQNEMYGGESGGIDRLMNEYIELNNQIGNLRARAALLRRQINKIFNDAGKDVIETRIRVYKKLPDEDAPIKSI